MEKFVETLLLNFVSFNKEVQFTIAKQLGLDASLVIISIQMRKIKNALEIRLTIFPLMKSWGISPTLRVL